MPLPRSSFSALRPPDTKSSCALERPSKLLYVRGRGQKNADAAWFYAEPKPAAKEIKPRGLLEKCEDRSVIHFSSRPRSTLLLKSRVGKRQSSHPKASLAETKAGKIYAATRNVIHSIRLSIAIGLANK
ncbi:MULTISPECIES: DUF427 domain-containing protein [unclassified Rhizobium]|uniref:DUF427 domain-containing protein n=1 Tax=unclassified Rhizobium TaxID=2613769 RepID=UPI0011602C46|nr:MULTISPECIES: DUF427 domain-containing protein [unclassified Rhizobium]TQX86887.1 DUF427 domain-containing protein [Rhizobium sp. rho-13.1]TQY08667.1 DUF427 domain-containing protein [Rhizobium sp. rho-1.1]